MSRRSSLLFFCCSIFIIVLLFALSSASSVPTIYAQPNQNPTEAATPDPEGAKADIKRGNAAFDNNDFDTAIALYTDAIRLDPRTIDAYSGRCDAYNRESKYELALADCQVAILLAPNDPLINALLGTSLETRGNF